MLFIIGVQVRVKGKRAEQTVLIAANHISWVDILALSAFARATFVSKSEIREWPLVGWFASEIGTVFLPRGGHQTRLANDNIIEHLKDDYPVAIFPEGTTTGQWLPKPFHARLFAAAIESDFPVQPIALRYLPPAGVDSGQHPAAPYINNIAFGEHFFGLVAARDVVLEIIFCPLISSVGRDRRNLAHAARASICKALGGEAPSASAALEDVPEQAGRSTHSTFT